MPQEFELSIITVNYNGLKDTCALIDSIPFNDELEVIVVDNGSKSDEAAIIKQRYPKVKAIRSEKNLGFAGGNNLGIQHSRGYYLYFINNDTVLCKDHQKKEEVVKAHFHSLTNRLKTSDKIGMVCPKIRFAWDDNPIQFAGYTPLSYITLRNHAIGYGEADKGQYDTPHPTPYAHGAAMMISRSALEDVGPMPECYFLYYEELDWSMMFTRAGYQIWYEPDATIYHKESQTTGADSPFKTYYVARNRLLFAKRNRSDIQRFASYCYLTGIVGLKDILYHLLKRRPKLAKATIKGICDFYFKTH